MEQVFLRCQDVLNLHSEGTVGLPYVHMGNVV